MLSVPRIAARAVPRFYRCTAVLHVSQRRNISSADIFNTTKEVSSQIPAVPLPPAPSKTLEEIVQEGGSVLEELGLWSPWKPTSYFRVALEGIHTVTDLPWWGTIVAGTVILRLALIVVPILSQRLVAKQSQYRDELAVFRQRQEDARRENNSMLQQQIFLEQRDFLISKDIKMGRQFMVLMANGAVFATQFFAIKKMIQVNYPGLSTGGTAWFVDLTANDPYYALPFISALTMAAVFRAGIETGASSDQMTPGMRALFQYGLPIGVFIASSQFASGICVYWCASNAMSLFYSGLFRVEAVRKLFKIPPVVKATADNKQKNAIKEWMSNRKVQKEIPPTLAQLREQDSLQFKKAGRGKPIIKKD